MGGSGHYTPRRTRDQAIQQKLKVLRGFYIVNNENEEEYRKVLLLAVQDEPNTHYDIVLDRVARRLIAEKLG